MLWKNYFECRILCQTEATIILVIFSDFLMVEQTFLLPQVKQSVITSNKHDTFDLPDGLPNHLILKILGN